MAHVEDRWYRPKQDGEGRIVLTSRGKPVMEPTASHGKGLRYRVRYIDPDRGERSKSFPDRQKKRADDFLIEVESDKREGKYIDPKLSRKTFRQQAENWYKVQSTDPATRLVLRQRLERRIYPRLGDLTFDRIERPATIRDWVGDLDERGFSENYKAVLFTVVSAVCESAVDDRIIRQNPCKAKTVRRPIGKSPKVVVWQEERLRSVCSGLPQRFGIVTKLGAGLGLRQGEILGFSPDDIDRRMKVVRVERQLKTVKGAMMFALPKGGKTREIPMAGSLLADIDSHVEQHGTALVTLPWGHPDGEPVTVRLLVTGEAGRLYSGDVFNKLIWRPAFAAAGLTYVRRADGMHALRHYFASVLLSMGCSVKELAEFLGHNDPGFTLRTYTHLVPSSLDRARSAIDTALGRIDPPTAYRRPGRVNRSSARVLRPRRISRLPGSSR
ncbi:tyrosine-type recombinase/integrase [Nocardia sp. NBC_01327]|uniref:tyrosine-type recombinase/integrase n=1 Tax=Nocardia sp. NBC_01327 TaxID=2903593 RepID=UPI002E15CB33|nr:tyrosine-type recombinase/integrase [Nocardia sp. NBC_01327]